MAMLAPGNPAKRIGHQAEQRQLARKLSRERCANARSADHHERVDHVDAERQVGEHAASRVVSAARARSRPPSPEVGEARTAAKTSGAAIAREGGPPRRSSARRRLTSARAAVFDQRRMAPARHRPSARPPRSRAFRRRSRQGSGRCRSRRWSACRKGATSARIATRGDDRGDAQHAPPASASLGRRGRRRRRSRIRR